MTYEKKLRCQRSTGIFCYAVFKKQQNYTHKLAITWTRKATDIMGIDITIGYKNFRNSLDCSKDFIMNAIFFTMIDSYLYVK